jgi:hypothetical protein
MNDPESNDVTAVRFPETDAVSPRVQEDRPLQETVMTSDAKGEPSQVAPEVSKSQVSEVAEGSRARSGRRRVDCFFMVSKDEI